MKYQFPELAYIAMSEFCILGYMGKECTHLYLENFPKLSFTEDGSLASWSVTYPTGVTLSGKVAVVSESVIETQVKVVNKSKRYFPGIDFTACLQLTEMQDEFSSIDHKLKYFLSTDGVKTFDELHHKDSKCFEEAEKMYLKLSVAGTSGVYKEQWANGEWTKYSRPVLEQAELPFIARKSNLHDRYVAVMWPRGRTILSNSGLACLHADPTVPNCPSGEEVSVHGAILFHQGDLASLMKTTQQLCQSLTKKDKVWKKWHI